MKAAEKAQGKGPKNHAEQVKGTNDGKAAKKDQELVLYEFIAMLVRISFQRANPTLGNFGDKREVTPLPGCLEAMLDEFVLPNGRRDTSAQFRETTMKDAAVVDVLEEFAARLKAWYKKTAADDSKEEVISSKLGMSEIVDVFGDRGIIGTWSVHQESEIVGDPTISRKEMSWKLSIPTVKSAFMDSQGGEQLGAAQASATDEMALFDFGEFQEFVARVGLEKYRPIKAMTPAAAVRAMHQNILGEKSEEQAVVEATRVSAARFDVASLAVALPGEGAAELASWLDAWGRMAFVDMHMFPLWEKEVRDASPRHCRQPLRLH